MIIHIEFCIKWNYGPEFERVAKIIRKINPNIVIESNSTYPRSGAFEVTIDKKIFFSKFSKDRFPTRMEVEDWINTWNSYII